MHRCLSIDQNLAAMILSICEQEVGPLGAKTRKAANDPVPPPLPDFTISFLNYVREQCRPLLAEEEREESNNSGTNAAPSDSHSACESFPSVDMGQRATPSCSIRVNKS
jgi:hypothetical protein